MVIARQQQINEATSSASTNQSFAVYNCTNNRIETIDKLKLAQHKNHQKREGREEGGEELKTYNLGVILDLKSDLSRVDSTSSGQRGLLDLLTLPWTCFLNYRHLNEVNNSY